MNQQNIINIVTDYSNNHTGNFINSEITLSPELQGLKMYDMPIFAFGSASDSMFENLKDDSIIGPHFIAPKTWMKEAETVISLFFPLSKSVKISNSKDLNWPSDQWLYARIEGYKYIIDVMQYLKDTLIGLGHNCIIPSLDKAFSTKSHVTENNREQAYYTSNWSERHVAFICGHGTFGLSKGLITAKGIAGRFMSIIVDFKTEFTTRSYQDIYEYCTMCGACIRKCPVNAISFENGKIHCTCSDFLDKTLKKFSPRYGCGKCQVNVPCESGIPKKNTKNI